MKTGTVNEDFGTAWHDCLACVSGLIACLMGDSAEEADKNAVRFSKRMQEVIDRNRGNRPDKTAITFEDIRFMTAGTLRFLLEELEATP